MSKKFIQLTSGWIPVSVMLLLAAALVTGQARATLPQEVNVLEAPTTQLSTSGLLDRNDLARLESIRILVNSILPMPENTELTIEMILHSGGDDIQSDNGLFE